MKVFYLILYFIYSNFHFSITQTFNFLSTTCLESFSNRTKMGDVFMYTYHPRTEIKTIVLSEKHTVHFPSTTKIVTIILIIKNENTHLAKVIYSDLSNDNIINDFFYTKGFDQWNRTDESTFEDLFVKLSNKLKIFNVSKLSEKWYDCGEGLSNQKLCTIQNNYFVKKIIMGNSLIWENELYYIVYAIGMSLKEDVNNNRLLLKIYCTIDDKNYDIDLEVEISQTHVFLFKKAWGLPTGGEIQAKSGLEKRRTSLDKGFRRIPHKSDVSRTRLDSKANRDRLKDIKLETEPHESNDLGYSKRHELILELNSFIYEPNPGIKVRLLKDDEEILWNSDDFAKNFVYARFFYIGESPILLNVKYITLSKSIFSRNQNNDDYLIKFQGWHILTEQKFNEELHTLSDAVTLYQLENVASGHCQVDVDVSDSQDSDLSQTYPIPKDEVPRLKNITLELFPSEAGNFRVSGYLMDGLDITYYEPTHGALVKCVKDGDNTIWDSDDGKRTLKYAKFCYKKDSKIFLSVLYSITNKNKTKEDKEDYFIKRDKWYHSPDDEFQRLLDLLINKVTMKARVINEKVSFEDHIKDLDISIKGPKPTWYEKYISRKKQTVIKLEAFEYDINDDGHDKFIIEVNINTRFGIYTPKTGLALSRIKDKERVIWFQETNGLGCTTLYMDFSGEDPLIHLILDDPLDSDMYYKKVEGNWHVIDVGEYEKIRKKPANESTLSNFVRIDNRKVNED